MGRKSSNFKQRDESSSFHCALRVAHNFEARKRPLRSACHAGADRTSGASRCHPHSPHGTACGCFGTCIPATFALVQSTFCRSWFPLHKGIRSRCWKTYVLCTCRKSRYRVAFLALLYWLLSLQLWWSWWWRNNDHSRHNRARHRLSEASIQ